MSSHEDNYETISQTQLTFEKLSNEVADLQIVEGFFSIVERKFLQFSNNSYDVKEVKDALATLKELQKSNSDEVFNKSEKLLLDLILVWRNKLNERDLAIETQQIRRFCDEFNKPFDSKVFIALARFYRRQSHSLSSQSKYDFAITRAFLKPTVCNIRELKFERDKIVSTLNDLNQSWDIQPSSTNLITEEVMKIITNFDEFIFKAEFVTSFEELVNSQLFENLRDFKTELGELFYHPAVTASAVECNVFVGNIFAELLARENEKLSRIISNEFDFASVLHDTDPTAMKTSNQILEHIWKDSLSQAVNPDEDAVQIWEWLQIVCSKKTFGNEEIGVESDEIAKIVFPAKERISNILAIVNDANSDKTLLSDYLKKSPSLKALDFGIFLSQETAEAQKGIFRATLGAVLWAEEIRNQELMKQDKLTDETSKEISIVLSELQTLSEQLRAKIDEMGAEVTHSLLYVSNQLLETRLKIERAIVRYSKQNLDTSNVPEENIQPTVIYEKQSFFTSSFAVSYWMVAATVLAVLFSFSAYFFINLLDNGIKRTTDIEIIETRNLSGRLNFKAAQRVRDTLYVTAKESWKTLSEEQQKEILNDLLQLQTKTPIVTVIVTDIAGNEVGIATAEQIETTAQLIKQVSD